MEYSTTLNLPKTSFPMKADLPRNEPAILSFWQGQAIYEKLRKHRQGREKFILHDGPPYSNGPIHMGQALNKILKDITVKYRSALGFDSPYVPGWDTHGLPNEIQAIKTYKINRREIDPIDLRAKCRESALHFLDVQRGQFIRLGIQGDFDHPYRTLDPVYEAAIVRVFGQMAKKGHVYRGLKPVHWCPVCETALAEAEIEYRDKRSPSIFVKFPIKSGAKKLFPSWEGPFSVLIWTTTPWTLPGNLAIALNPGADYVLVKASGEAYLVAESLLPSVVASTGLGEYELLGKVKGSALEGEKALHPFLERDSLIINCDYVVLDDPEAGGTGCVHTAPGHGAEDFEAGLKYSLPVLVPVDDRGFLTDEAGPFKGLRYEEANEHIIAHMAQSGHLLHRGTKEHSYPHCWRCRGPVIFRATRQWFIAVDVERLRERAMEAIKQTRWIPSWGEERIYNMVKTRPDWCISRQRIWGTPIPAFYCDACHEAIFTNDSFEAVEKLFLAEGADSWYRKQAAEILPRGFECPHCHGRSFTKEMDIFDVWFESGVSHEAVCAVREQLRWPSDLYLEGSDQHRGWFQVSLLPAMATRGKAPYKAVLTHGWVLDEKGHTMHKSLGNVIDPMQMVEKYGADILRLFFASVDYTADIKIYHDAILQVAEVYKKIRNTCRFMLGNLYDFDPKEHAVKESDLLEIDRWILQQKHYLVKKLDEAYGNYQFHVVYYHLHNFCAIQLSSMYMDVVKDRLYVSPPGSLARRSAQTALYETLRDLTVVMYPILSFTSEEIWQNYFKPRQSLESVQLAEWPADRGNFLTTDEESKWNFYSELRDQVYFLIEELRKEKVIKQSLEARIEIYPDEKRHEMLAFDSELLKRFFIVSQLKVHGAGDNAPEESRPLELFPEIRVTVKRAPGEKCARCWNYDEKPLDQGEFPGICERCIAAVKEIEKVG
ncbi:MAG: isoleucine--tRNA ligase [Candidatus Eremiobacteraeota bacterium]|nr:isoleucine--tRNA ligase [Candidatus Eremiobacteraeota bacterium]